MNRVQRRTSTSGTNERQLASLDAKSMVCFEFSPAFAISGGKSVLTYDSDNALLSGWLLGGKLLNRKSVLVEALPG